MKKMTNKMMRK